jgi:hypothetical protein
MKRSFHLSFLVLLLFLSQHLDVVEQFSNFAVESLILLKRSFHLGPIAGHELELAAPRDVPEIN